MARPLDIAPILAAVRHVLGDAPRPIALHEPRFAGKEQEYLNQCIQSGWVSSAGPFVERFERDLAQYTGAAHAVLTVNGTAALHIALKLAGVNEGDEVLIPALTFVATANAVAYCQAVPHFVDIEQRTLGMDPRKLGTYLEQTVQKRGRNCLNRKTGRRIAAVVPMHTFGHPVDLQALVPLCRYYELPFIEDAAEAVGSRYAGRHTGTFGCMGVLSFNGNKIVTTGGGGAILTNDPDLAKAAKHLTTTAKVPHAWELSHDQLGYNYRMPNLNAALGCAQLEQLPDFLRAKRALAGRYAAAFSNMPGVRFFTEVEPASSNHWLNTLIVEPEHAAARDSIIEELHREGIHVRPAWKPMHQLPMYAHGPMMDLSTTESLAARIVNLPSSAICSRPMLHAENAQRKICVVTGSRADYGLLYWVMKRLQAEPSFQLQVVAIGAHLSSAFGATWKTIEADGFAPVKVDMQLAGDDPASISQATARGLAGMAGALGALRPDLLLVLGDRYEILAAVTAATIARIPVAHLCGGDISEGAFDDAFRHAITKLSHVHFVTNELSAQRVRQMGEDPSRVHVVGSTGLDAIRQLQMLNRAQLEQELGLAFRQRNLLVTFHPVTLAPVPSVDQLGQLLAALESLGPDFGIFFTAANADPEGQRLNDRLRAWTAAHPNARFFESLGQKRYLSLMVQVNVVVGNSSSGLYEAPALRVPTVNIGTRQAGRLHPDSVLDCPPQASAIAAAIQRAMAMPRPSGATPYGDGHAADHIVEALRAIPDFRALLYKRFFLDPNTVSPRRHGGTEKSGESKTED